VRPGQRNEEDVRGIDLDSKLNGNLDEAASRELNEIKDRIAAVWLDGTLDVLTRRNPELLEELNRLESVLDSLLVIPSWPIPIRKQWRVALADYEKTAMLCVTYARRHLQLVAQA